ncbi:MAG: contact-dependent growth inhibition system immunity protein [Rhizobiaceae bacterium]
MNNQISHHEIRLRHIQETSNIRGEMVGETLEELEADFWGEPEFDSRLEKICHQLRKKPVHRFTAEDLRIMIGQNIGLAYLIPEALNKLRKQPLISGNLYEGDLLNTLISSEWVKTGTYSNLNTLLVKLCRAAMAQLENSHTSHLTQDTDHTENNPFKSTIPYRDFAEFCRNAEKT